MRQQRSKPVEFLPREPSGSDCEDRPCNDDSQQSEAAAASGVRRSRAAIQRATTSRFTDRAAHAFAEESHWFMTNAYQMNV
jgi:hypothetical protein